MPKCSELVQLVSAVACRTDDDTAQTQAHSCWPTCPRFIIKASPFSLSTPCLCFQWTSQLASATRPFDNTFAVVHYVLPTSMLRRDFAIRGQYMKRWRCLPALAKQSVPELPSHQSRRSSAASSRATGLAGKAKCEYHGMKCNDCGMMCIGGGVNGTSRDTTRVCYTDDTQLYHAERRTRHFRKIVSKSKLKFFLRHVANVVKCSVNASERGASSRRSLPALLL
ncbi:hypothetical protein EVAR_93212_1 [Eumeta japonica]|uniref:Uncharacterized protein n=1 Tax=Eumeta variegata TaxID=151549 RepID=A0A4C1TY49_EUMVA|nr:hypothetical protein EVAR_93212_1 [Eumeta japonica]